MGNAVVHFEIGGPDDAPLVAFCGELFGWGLQSFGGGRYTLIDTNGGGINGGIGKSQTGEPWSTSTSRPRTSRRCWTRPNRSARRRSCLSPTSAVR